MSYGVQVLKIGLNGNYIASDYKYFGTYGTQSGSYEFLNPGIIEYKPDNYVLTFLTNLNFIYFFHLLKLDNNLNVISSKVVNSNGNNNFIIGLLSKTGLLKKNNTDIIIFPNRYDYYFYPGQLNKFLVIDTNLNNTFSRQLNDASRAITSVSASGNDLIIGGIMYSNKLVRNQFDTGYLHENNFLLKYNLNTTGNFQNQSLLFCSGYAPKYSNYNQPSFHFFNNSIYCTSSGYASFSDHNNFMNDSLSNNFRTRISKFDSALQIKWNKRLHIYGTADTSGFQSQNGINNLYETQNVLVNKNNQLLNFSAHYPNSNSNNTISDEEVGFSLSAIDTAGNNATCNATDEPLLFKYDSLEVLDKPLLNFVPDTITLQPNTQIILDVPLKKISNVCLPLKGPKSKFFWFPLNSYGFNNIVCKDSKLFLYDRSYNEPKTWHWIFPPEANISELDSLYLPNVHSITFNQAGVYPVSLVTTNDAGTDTTTQYITVINFIPQPHLGNDTTICNGDSIRIIYNNPANSAHYFIGPNIFTTGDTLVIKDSGRYVIAAYTACGYLYDTINVKVAFKPTAKFGATVSCNNLTVAFTDSSKLNGNPNITYQYAWKPALAPATAYTNYSTLPNNSFTFAAYDSFDVRLIIKSPLNCVEQDTIVKRIILKSTPLAACSAITNCGSLQVNFTSAATIATGTIVQQEYYSGTTLIGTGTSFTYNFASYGSYVIKQVVKSNFNCISDTFLLPLIIRDKPQVNLVTARDSVCNSSSYTITANATVNASSIANYVWLKDNALLLNNTNTITETNPTGSYTYKLVATSALGCFSDTAIKTITVVSKPTASINAINNCGSKQINITSTATVINDNISSHFISYGDGNTGTANPNNTTYNYTNYGTYTIKYVVQSSVGCASDTVYQTIAVKDKPQVNLITNRDSVCNNSSYSITANTTVSASTISSYVWLKNNVLLPNNTNTIAETNPTGTYTYKLVATSAQGCPGDTAVKTITVVSKPTAAINAINNCGSKSIAITASAFVVNDAITTHYVNYGDGNSGIINPNNTTYTYSNYGSYTIKYVVKSSVGCASDTVYQTIVVKDKPVVNISYSNNACQNTNYVLTATASVSASNITNYTWLKDGVVQSSANSVLTDNSIAGTYVYKVIAASATGCGSDTAVQAVVVEKYPTTIFTASGGCVGKPIVITNGSINNNTVGSVQYLWTTNDGQTSTAAVPDFSFMASGTKTIQLTTTTQNGCANSITKTITIDDYPVAAFDITEACMGKNITISNNSTGTIASYAWQTSNAQQSAGVVPQFIFNAPGNYSIKLQVATANNCIATTTKNTSITPVQLFTTPAIDTNAVTGQPVQISITGAATYTWLPASNLNNATSSNPVFTASVTGIYPLVAEGTTAQGCKGNATLTIKVFAGDKYLFIPNAFTPNADGVNDKFHITCSGLQALTSFTVYNRYGQIVYHQNNCSNSGWDGTFNGTAQPQGAYVYNWQGIAFNGKAISGKGSVILIR
ncbi:PKD domain-containing protein [Ferruginibacter sp. SUN106]|uniref:gliding motility-associated C-terminal domain-containing protein n=1 Tax=Ferruginibacter sp. SUN106 TaxID=2978348 RepID=UPI003D365429